MSNNEQSLILKAQKSDSIMELKSLSTSVYSNVRVCVAKNKYSSYETINDLAVDCVVRVSFWALKNKKCTVKRELRQCDLSHKCIKCLKDESTFYKECQKCN